MLNARVSKFVGIFTLNAQHKPDLGLYIETDSEAIFLHFCRK